MKFKNKTVIFILISLFIFIRLIYISRDKILAATNPSLGLASTFGILASTYTNTVSGTTITGDLGYTTGPAVAPTVSGTTHVGGGTYSTAGTDQGSALADLDGQACTFTFASGAIDLATDTTHGTMGIYAPGVYCTGAASAASIGSGGITLSGSGTYIFRITGALTTVVSSVVTLANGASSCDVFWTPGEATTLGANSTFIGTDIDAAGITIGSTVTWRGRALAFGGTVTTDTDTIDTTCSVAPTPTPSPSPTPTPTPSSSTSSSTTSSTSSTSSSSSSGGDSTCVAPEITTIPTILESRRVSSTSMYLRWGPYAGIETFNIRYGVTRDTWSYNTDVTGFSTTINDLIPNQPFWFQVAARNNCFIGSYGEARLVGGTILGNPQVPGLPNTGGDNVPGFPSTGFGPNPKQFPWLVIFGLSSVFAIFCLFRKKFMNLLTKILSIFIITLILGVNSKTVLAAESVSTLYIPLIGITSVPNPPTLPNGAGNVTYDYSVKNFLQEVALTDVTVSDDKCGYVKYIEGDDNRDSKLDYSETWRYRCTTKLLDTTTNTATVTAIANNVISSQKAYSTVVVGSDNEYPIVSIVNITKVVYPLTLPAEGGEITFTYKVNNPGDVPLDNVGVSDDGCSAMSGQLGDTNANKLLDPKEVWIYNCTTDLKETTTSTARVKAYANGNLATGESTITVIVDSGIKPGLPDTGTKPDSKIFIWRILIGILGVLLIILILSRRGKRRGKYVRK